MLGLWLAEVIAFCVAIGISLFFVITWILKSEAGRNILKDELTKLKSQVETYERERFMMLEKISKLEGASSQLQEDEQKIEADNLELKKLQEEISGLKNTNIKLTDDNEKLKKQADEAISSLEEIYKAFEGKK